MELAITIPDDEYRYIKKSDKNVFADVASKECMLYAIKNGTPLPKGEWLRISQLSEQEDDRYKCSRCGNVVHYANKMNLYTFNSWCGRCGSDNRRKGKVL